MRANLCFFIVFLCVAYALLAATQNRESNILPASRIRLNGTVYACAHMPIQSKAPEQVWAHELCRVFLGVQQHVSEKGLQDLGKYRKAIERCLDGKRVVDIEFVQLNGAREIAATTWQFSSRRHWYLWWLPGFQKTIQISRDQTFSDKPYRYRVTAQNGRAWYTYRTTQLTGKTWQVVVQRASVACAAPSCNLTFVAPRGELENTMLHELVHTAGGILLAPEHDALRIADAYFPRQLSPIRVEPVHTDTK